MEKLIKFDLDKIGLFRKAEPQDIVQGNIVYLIGDGNIMHKMIIDEVLNPNDERKAFCADDGCRYGLLDLYVTNSNNDLQKRIQHYEKTIDLICDEIMNLKK